MARGGYRCVLFDVGETLIGPADSFGAVYARAVDPLGLRIDADRAERALRETWAEIDRMIPPGVDRYAYYPGGEDEYWGRFAARTLERATGRPVPPALAAAALERIRAEFRDGSAWRIYPDAVPTLDALRERGLRLGIVSNWDSRLPSLLASLRLAPYFDTIVFSHAEGVEKPSPAIFLRALERLDTPADRALHVGDVPELDGEGARAAGIDSVIVDRRGRFDGSHETVRDLREVLTLVTVPR